MVTLATEDVSLTTLVTVIACLQMGHFAVSVANARKRYRIWAPAVSGDLNFERLYRAQQNAVEFFGIFMAMLWTASLLCNQYLASIAGMLYIFGRQSYFEGYSKDAKEREPGFRIALLTLLVLLLLTVFGLAQALLHQYIGVDLKDTVALFAGLK